MAGPWERYKPTDGPWSKFKPAAPAPAKENQPEAWNPVAGVARSLVDGIPVVGPLYTGAVDRITSGIAGMVTGEDPEAIRNRVYAKQDAFKEENPILDTAAQVVGGGVAMAPLAATATGAKVLGMTGNLAQRGAMGALSGTGISAADSAARGGDMGDVATNAAVGGVLGGALGAATPLISKGVSAASDKVRGWLGQAGNGIPGSELSETARSILTRALMGSGALGEGGIENVAKAGKSAMLADASPAAAGLLDTVIQRGGPGAKQAFDAVEARAAQANRDIGGALDTALGKPQGVHTTEGALRSNSAAPRTAAYEAAYASPIDYASPAGMQIEELVGRVPGNVITTANRMMALEGKQSAQIMAQIADDGTVTFTQMPDVRQLDYITRALNQLAKSGEGQGALGGQTDIGRLYGNLARDIRSSTKEAAPAYAEALETAAKPIQAREALRFGEGILSPNVPRDEAIETIAGMTGPEREAARQGLRSYIDEVLANVRAVASDTNIDARQAVKALRDLSSPAARQKVTALVGDDEVARVLFEQLDEAGTALGLRASVAQNSKTYARQAMDQTLSENFEHGVVNTALQGKPINAIQSGVQALTGRTPRGIGGMKDRVAGELGAALTMPGQDAMNLISGLAALRNAQPKRINALAGMIAPGASALGNIFQ